MTKYDQTCICIVQAVSIVRTKPLHMSGKVYAQVLDTQLTGNEKHWRSKVMASTSDFARVRGRSKTEDLIGRRRKGVYIHMFMVYP